MSRDHIDRPKHRRRLSEEELRLWSGIIRSIAPLKRKAAGTGAHHRVASVAAHERTAQNRRAGSRPAHPVVKPAAKPVPSVGGLDRRQKQRLARGREPIDRRIDLHGRTQSEAHAVLLGFLRQAQADGARFVLVITGKGGFSALGGAAERGILRRQVPQWLRQGEFRPYVLAAEDAHRTHGGEGALYIRIRPHKT